MCWKGGNVNDVPDPNMKGVFERDVLFKIVPLALWCVEIYSRRRPTMTQVVQQLSQMGLKSSSPLLKEKVV